ncbi:unnamed protein product [Cyprideis torosa]|uniref:Mutator-like transposase domain-containing protein n=1 Tax=Cyprideis torosa TaxID=163714 RepID=A0A7R8ZN14_9CRUS|nr:unnamed protein product [Cyprideis torosa]CAG0895179.1 unnamed protein product [Cyprideis torosa]
MEEVYFKQQKDSVQDVTYFAFCELSEEAKLAALSAVFASEHLRDSPTWKRFLCRTLITELSSGDISSGELEVQSTSTRSSSVSSPHIPSPKGTEPSAELEVQMTPTVGVYREDSSLPSTSGVPVGSVLNVTGKCPKCGPHQWSSSPRTNKFYDVNLDLATSTFLTGMNIASLERAGKCMGLALPHRSTFYRIQESFVYDAVDTAYEIQQQELIEDLRQRERIDLAGDGRYSAPGYSAKYCTYSLMDDATKKVVHTEVLQCSESTSSVAMENDACQAALRWAKSTFGKSPTSVCTDRHKGIQKMMKKKYPKVNHIFDAWHMQKSLGKALGRVGIRGGQRELQTWARHLTNHLLWSIRNCGGSYSKLLHIWSSCLRHVVNDHNECYHGELPDDEVRPKRIGVKKPHFVTKVKVAVLDHNANVGRGVDYMVVRYSRATKRYLLLGIKEEKNDNWRQPIREEVFQLARTSTVPSKLSARKRIDRSLPQTVAKVPRPTKSILLQQHELQKRRRTDATYQPSENVDEKKLRSPGYSSTIIKRNAFFLSVFEKETHRRSTIVKANDLMFWEN